MPTNTTFRRLLVLLALALTLFLLTACEPTPTPDTEGASATPTKAAANADPTATPVPDPTATPASEAGASGQGMVTAMAWYALAEETALKWQADAVLSAVNGGSRDGSMAHLGEAIPPDGRTNLWSYTFVSSASRQRLSISIREGELIREKANDLTQAGQPVTAEDMLWYTGLYPGSDWTVDSTAAVEIATPLHVAQHGAPPEALTYVLFSSKEAAPDGALSNSMRWVIGGDPEGPSFQVNIDARTGKILK